MRPYFYLMRLHKPLPVLLILWPTITAVYLALDGSWNIKFYLIFTLGVFFMRTAGCIINDIADRKYDGLVERSKNRPLASKELSVKQALICALVLVFLGFICVLFLNKITIMMSFIALILAIIYPFFKRFFYLPQLILGMAFNFGILMAYTAIKGEITLSIWVFYSAMIIWTLAYDTIYALADKPYDIEINLKSSAITFGRHVFLMIFALQLLSLVLLSYFGFMMHFNIIYYALLVLVLFCFIWQYFYYKTLLISECIKAFSSNHWVGLIIFIAVIFQRI